MSPHLCHVGAERAEAMEGLIDIFHDLFYGRVYRPDLARIVVDLGYDSGLGGSGLGVGVGGGGPIRSKLQRQ